MTQSEKKSFSLTFVIPLLSSVFAFSWLLLVTFGLGLNNIPVEAAGNISMYKGQTRVVTISYKNEGDQETSSSLVRIYIGNKTTLDTSSIRERFDTDGDGDLTDETEYCINPSVVSTDPGVVFNWGYLITYRPRSATTTTATCNGESASGNANIPVNVGGTVSFRLTLKTDLSEPVGTTLTTAANQGIKAEIIMDGATGVGDETGISIAETPPVPDSDNDGIPDDIECPAPGNNFNNAGCPDTDKDGVSDYQDTDSDGDGIPDTIERGNTCTSVTNCTPVDTDSDGTPDYRDLDSDNDGIPDSFEKGETCHTLINCVPIDTDKDGTPDYRDTDSDNDGVFDRYECPGSYTVATPCRDTDFDTLPNYRDPDDDNDNKPTTSEQADPNENGNDEDAVDSDGDKVVDYLDPDILLNEDDIKNLSDLACLNGVVNSTTTCTFTLPANRTLPANLKFGVGTSTPAGTCSLAGSKVTCVSVPTGSQAGTQKLYSQIGDGNKFDTGKTVNITAATVIRTGGYAAVSIIALVSSLIAFGIYLATRKRKLVIHNK